MKIDLTTGTWQDNPGCPINITLVSTSDEDSPLTCYPETRLPREVPNLGRPNQDPHSHSIVAPRDS